MIEMLHQMNDEGTLYGEDCPLDSTRGERMPEQPFVNPSQIHKTVNNVHFLREDHLKLSMYRNWRTKRLLSQQNCKKNKNLE